jgi:hypothetical protein
LALRLIPGRAGSHGAARSPFWRKVEINAIDAAGKLITFFYFLRSEISAIFFRCPPSCPPSGGGTVIGASICSFIVVDGRIVIVALYQTAIIGVRVVFPGFDRSLCLL